MSKHYYAGSSYMGIGFTFDSPCWEAYQFNSRRERDEWVKSHEYNDQGNIVSVAISLPTAIKIAGKNAVADRDGRLVQVWNL